MGDNKRNIIIADSQYDRIQILRELLGSGYNITDVSNGEQLIKAIADKFHNLSAIILDVDIQKVKAEKIMDILSRKKMTKFIPVIIMADKDPEITKLFYDKGAAAFLRKPYDSKSTKAKIDTIIQTYAERKWLEKKVIKQNRDLNYQTDMLRKLNDNILDMVGTMVEFRGIEGHNHIHRVREYSKIMGEAVASFFKEYKLGAEEIQYISSASRLHDIGKILIPDTIVLKAGKLTGEEFEIMKSHTTKGCELLDVVFKNQSDKAYKYFYDICRYHHERHDGKGYPEGLAGDEIPISAQIVSVVEAFDALMCNTVHRKAVSFERAFEMIVDGECGTFSPKIIQCFQVSMEKLRKVSIEYAD